LAILPEQKIDTREQLADEAGVSDNTIAWLSYKALSDIGWTQACFLSDRYNLPSLR